MLSIWYDKSWNKKTGIVSFSIYLPNIKIMSHVFCKKIRLKKGPLNVQAESAFSDFLKTSKVHYFLRKHRNSIVCFVWNIA